MNYGAWIRTAESRLTGAGIATARLDCLVLLEDATGKDRGWLLAHPESELPKALTDILDARIYRRSQHVPLAYIRGTAEFYGRVFAVNAHTLVPRPETETMIEALRHLENLTPQAALLDIGTGSGAIAITAKLELPEAAVFATDIDEQCLQIARQNAAKLGADITFLSGNLLEAFERRRPVSGRAVLLCNLPYVPDNFQINTAATHEPRHALFGGPDGLDLYRELFEQIKTNAWKPAYILTETLPTQHEALIPIAESAGYALRATDDFIQTFSQS